jgi:hypothetical protein
MLAPAGPLGRIVAAKHPVWAKHASQFGHATLLVPQTVIAGFGLSGRSAVQRPVHSGMVA